MVDEQQRDELAHKLLERHLVSNRDEALELATKFLEMEVEGDDRTPVPEDVEAPSLIGDALESAPAAQQAYASVLYYERLKLEPRGAALNTRAQEDLPQPAEPAPVKQREAPTVDISQMFNVDNMRKNVQES